MTSTRAARAAGSIDATTATVISRERRNEKGGPKAAFPGIARDYFFAASTGIRSNFPSLWMKTTQSEALSQPVVCR